MTEPSNAGSRAGQAYFVTPADGRPAPGVLLLPSWWGTTAWVEERANALSDLGYAVLVPDLMGAVYDDAQAARSALAESDPNDTAALVLSSIVALRSQTVDPEAPIAVVGYSMGGSWALWASARNPGSIGPVVSYYGAQAIDFARASGPILCHFALADALVGEEDRVVTEAELRMGDLGVDVHLYEAEHFFAEVTPAITYDETAAALADRRTVEFLSEHHPPSVEGEADQTE